MDKFMFAVLVVWGILAFTVSQEPQEAIGGAENVEKPGGCPEVGEEDPVSSICSDLCNNKENCTVQTCVTDSQCDGSLKCCKTTCGTECLPPVFRSPCENNLDCPWTLKCCNGVCDSDCVYHPEKPELNY